jgi:5-methylcytosine-specific restriction endonuclease McrA
MVLRVLKRLTSFSTSTSGDGRRAGQRPGAEERRSRSSLVGEPLPSWVRMHVWWRDQGRCVRCGSRERLWFDYIVPVSEGGGNTEGNIRLLCERCDRREKGASTGWRKR